MKKNKKENKKQYKKNKKAAEQKNDQKKITRGESITLALKLLKVAKKDEILAKADKLFTESGGKSNLRETAFTSGHVFSAFIAAGILEKDKDGNYSYKLQ